MKKAVSGVLFHQRLILNSKSQKCVAEFYNISCRLSFVACTVASISSFVIALHRNQVSKAEGGK
jgi:hypothetical protein